MVAFPSDSRYELLEPIGAGTSGTVFRANDRRLGRQVAVKVMTRDAVDEGSLRRLHREARVAAAFRHPNAVDVYEVGIIDDRPYIAMELVSGVSLAVSLRRSTTAVPIASVVEIGLSLADVLAAAHATGLVHRDVKPANIFLDGSLEAPGRVRLVDFGLAFTIAGSESMGRLTDEGVLVGTPAYMSPEQAEGALVGSASDVYSLGCLLYELVSGRTPFVGNIPKMLTGHLYLPPIPLSELDHARAIPSGLDAEIMRTLVKEPDSRPAASELVSRLAAIDLSETRSGTSDRTRAERSAGYSAPGRESVPVFELDEIRVGAVGLESHEVETLRDLGVVVDNDGPQVMLVRVADDGGFDDRGCHNLPLVGLHPSPSPKLIALAVRSGLAGVVRWPSPLGVFRTRLRAALGHSRRVPGR